MFEVRYYVDDQGATPAKLWLDSLPPKARQKGSQRIELLAELGNELKRPFADYLRDGIYELRWEWRSVQYRLLYFFIGKQVVIVSHSFSKRGIVPPFQIQRAITRKEELKGLK
jgi:phage-related protein